jgi:hypothetical protein
VNDSVGFKPHQTRKDRVGSYRVIRNNNLPQRTSSAVKGAVALHGCNAVRDNEVDWNGCAQIENALLNAFPVEDILRPSVSWPATTPNMFYMLSVTPDQ